jgi:ArsR family transcriptional regulator
MRIMSSIFIVIECWVDKGQYMTIYAYKSLKTSSENSSLFPMMAGDQPSPEMLEMIARRFHAMGEPMRLRVLVALQAGERSVGEVVKELGTSQANVSKHLQVLAASGLLKRRKHGLKVLYSIADPDIFNMCSLVCGSLKRDFETRSKMFPTTR